MVGPFLTAWVQSQPDIVAMIGVRFRPQHEASTGRTFPYATFFIVSDDTAMSLTGSNGLCQKRVQIDLMGRDYGQVDRLAALFKGTRESPRLNGYQGTLGGVVVSPCLVTGRQDVYEEPVVGEGEGVHRVILDLEIWHKE